MAGGRFVHPPDRRALGKGCRSHLYYHCSLNTKAMILKTVSLNCQYIQLSSVIHPDLIGHSYRYGRPSAEFPFQKPAKRVQKRANCHRFFFLRIIGLTCMHTFCFLRRVETPSTGYPWLGGDLFILPTGEHLVRLQKPSILLLLPEYQSNGIENVSLYCQYIQLSSVIHPDLIGHSYRYGRPSAEFPFHKPAKTSEEASKLPSAFLPKNNWTHMYAYILLP